MLTVNKLLPAGKGLARALVRRAPTVELDWDVRQKSRFDAVDSAGRPLGVFLARGTAVRGGDVLVAEDGSLVRVVARPQPVMTVTACAEHGSPFDLLRAAYHLGNRHVALQLEPDRLAFEPDRVLAELLRRMHLIVTEHEAPFEPESGAYAAAGTPAGSSPAARRHGHDHGHGHGHVHDHGHDHGHRHGDDDRPDHDGHDHDGHRHADDEAHAHDRTGSHGHPAPDVSTAVPGAGDPSPGRLD